jgi:hypothetical protein
MSFLTPLSRGEFFSRIGLLQQIDPLVDEAYRFSEQLEQLKSDRGEQAKDNWHVSFHGSHFPGNDRYACGRRALYTLMDIPRPPASRKLRQTAEAGKALENFVVDKWYYAGRLLTAPSWEHQNQFEDADYWLTSTVDSIVALRGSTLPVVVELKSKYAKEIERMRKLLRGPDDQHVKQLKCQIGLAHEKTVANPIIRRRCFNTGRVAIPALINGKSAELICPQHRGFDCLQEEIFEPVQYGFLYYISRDNPCDTWEFYYEYDPSFMESGREKLKQWREAFIEETLPQTNFENKRYSHPFNWKWTVDGSPCKWCNFGTVCRNDHDTAKQTQKPIRLAESAAVDFAKGIRLDYDWNAVKEAVLARWGLT